MAPAGTVEERRGEGRRQADARAVPQEGAPVQAPGQELVDEVVLELAAALPHLAQAVPETTHVDHSSLKCRAASQQVPHRRGRGSLDR
jgi:hypothetical protein